MDFGRGGPKLWSRPFYVGLRRPTPNSFRNNRMHGIIFTELRNYVTSALGQDAWPALIKEAGLEGKSYLPVKEYPDEEVGALVSAAARITKKPAGVVMEGFGIFLAPKLLAMYRSLVDPAWRTLDVIENTEQTIHRVVRIRNPGAHPPALRTTRTGPKEVVLLYNSHRRMCNVAIGIAKGVGVHFGENISITETRCMHRGAPECEIVIRKMDL